MPEGLRPLRHLFAAWFYTLFSAVLPALGVSRLRARPKGFPVALWKPSGPYLVERLGNGNLWFYWTPVGIRALGYFPGLWEQIAAPGAYRRGPWFIAGLLFFVLQTLHLVELAHRVL